MKKFDYVMVNETTTLPGKSPEDVMSILEVSPGCRKIKKPCPSPSSLVENRFSEDAVGNLSASIVDNVTGELLLSELSENVSSDPLTTSNILPFSNFTLTSNFSNLNESAGANESNAWDPIHVVDFLREGYIFNKSDTGLPTDFNTPNSTYFGTENLKSVDTVVGPNYDKEILTDIIESTTETTPSFVFSTTEDSPTNDSALYLSKLSEAFPDFLHPIANNIFDLLTYNETLAKRSIRSTRLDNAHRKVSFFEKLKNSVISSSRVKRVKRQTPPEYIFLSNQTDENNTSNLHNLTEMAAEDFGNSSFMVLGDLSGKQDNFSEVANGSIINSYPKNASDEETLISKDSPNYVSSTNINNDSSNLINEQNFTTDPPKITQYNLDENFSTTIASSVVLPITNTKNDNDDAEEQNENETLTTSVPTTTNSTFNTDEYPHYADGSFGQDQECFILEVECDGK